MAFAASGLVCLLENIGSGPSVWYYASTDAHGTVEGVDYFASCKDYGMAVGDVVFVVDTDTGPGNTTIHSVTAVDDDGNVSISTALLA